MSIFRYQRELQARYHGLRPIERVYRGTQLIWEAIRSCFGSGVWKGERPWLGNDAWKNE